MLASSLAALAALASVARAAHSCPAGTLYGTAFNNVTYPATINQIESVVGNFQSSDWQGLAQTAAAGADNTPNVSTRTVSYSGLSLVEELTSVETYANGSTYMWNLTNGPVQLSAQPAINISAYYETLVVVAQCDGLAASVYWTVDFCYSSQDSADYNSTIAGVFSSAHSTGLANISTILNVGQFTDCATTKSTSPGTASPSSSATKPSGSAVSTATGSAPSASASASGKSSGAESAHGAATILAGGALALAGLLALI